MTNVVLYSEQPILVAGLQAAMAGLEDIAFSAIFTDIESLADHFRTSRPGVVLLDLSTMYGGRRLTSS